jgi:fructosamine-3-kinase
MRELFHHISQQLSQHFSRSVQFVNEQQVFGGDINQAFHLNTNIGSFFLKVNDGRMNDMFEREFEGLQLLYQTNTIKVPIPVIQGGFNGHIFLVTEFIQRADPSKNFWQTFARELAALHQHSNDMFGLATSNFIGSLQQENNLCETWAEFYARQRILPLVELAFNQHKFSKENVLLVERLCARFDDLFPREKPSLLHGDLWSGNFVCNTEGRPVIYDPAVYYGSREMDIAMSLLFGGFDRSFYTYYSDAFPLQAHWHERVRLCQLYPLFVHLILFGGHYYHSVMEIIEAYV